MLHHRPMHSTPSNRTVLVTGGAGYVGSHACKALSRAGYRPVVYDNLGNGRRDAVKWGPLVEGEIADRARLDEVIERHAPGAVLHFAAFIEAGASMIDPGAFYRNNVAGTLTLLEALRDHNIERLVFSSTAAVYGIPRENPIPEAHPTEPVNVYGATKLMVETMLEDFARAHGLRSMVLRYFNAAGADPEGELGENHDPESHLIPLVLQVAAGERPHITIFGEDYVTHDGTCIRDYVHVADLAEAHALALLALENGARPDVYNLGNGRGFSVREVIDAVQRVTGREVPVRTGDRRPGDPDRLIADAARAREGLGWSPRHADLDEIVATAWAWHRSPSR